MNCCSMGMLYSTLLLKINSCKSLSEVTLFTHFKSKAYAWQKNEKWRTCTCACVCVKGSKEILRWPPSLLFASHSLGSLLNLSLTLFISFSLQAISHLISHPLSPPPIQFNLLGVPRKYAFMSSKASTGVTDGAIILGKQCSQTGGSRYRYWTIK